MSEIIGRKLRGVSLFAATALCLLACAPREAATPTETFKTYVKASQKKDAAAMRLLLSNATLKMHEQEAKAQGTKIDDIIMRDTLVGEGQRTVEYRNESIVDEKATLEYKTSYGSWETIAFVREDGVWKIDKQSVMDQMLQDMDEGNRKLDDAIRGVTPPN
jgi:hypothetical protein